MIVLSNFTIGKFTVILGHQHFLNLIKELKFLKVDSFQENDFHKL